MTTATLTPVHTTIASPVGELLLTGDGERLSGLHMQDGRRPGAPGAESRRADEPFAEVREQLDQYFAGERTGSTCRWRRTAPRSSSACGTP